ncbi:hypothetical protein F503_08309 [Ophiostoma piceae UAMH 11346]|uniref:Uncharacterized protein n=1 Tax=Ophiostoma piceae (strain UAMH 11346) TaxID=1262450 RepID=S3CHH4_OPHP1|nr:hypothetical protein F503_08309 [Ophiostoma piceae UAMH 11346]
METEKKTGGQTETSGNEGVYSVWASMSAARRRTMASLAYGWYEEGDKREYSVVANLTESRQRADREFARVPEEERNRGNPAE